MTPKEKAIELINKFDKAVNTNSNTPLKKCALISVDEMISQMLSLMKFFNEDRSEFEAIELDYLTKVKQ
jgi:hypothetical protein